MSSFGTGCVMGGVAASTATIRLDLGADPVNQPYGMLHNQYIDNPPCVQKLTYGGSSIGDYQSQSDWLVFNATTASQEVDYYQVHDPSWAGTHYPYQQEARIEGSLPSDINPGSGDRHVLVLDGINCKLYESWNSINNGAGGWSVANTAIWDMTNTVNPNKQRPAGWTSADAAGLAVYPGVLKYAEIADCVAKGKYSVGHAIRFTSPTAQSAYANPGRHFGPSSGTKYPWYGARFRLTASFSETPYSADTLCFIHTLKKYGLIFADQGSTLYVTGDNDPGFGINMLNEINSAHKIAWSNFELVQPIEAITRSTVPNPNPPTCTWDKGTNPPQPTPGQVFTPSYNPSWCPAAAGTCNKKLCLCGTSGCATATNVNTSYHVHPVVVVCNPSAERRLHFHVVS